MWENQPKIGLLHYFKSEGNDKAGWYVGTALNNGVWSEYIPVHPEDIWDHFNTISQMVDKNDKIVEYRIEEIGNKSFVKIVSLI